MTLSQIPEILDEELFTSILNLLSQLKVETPKPSRTHLINLLGSKNSTLFIARHPDQNGPIVGMLTFAFYLVPSGICAHIEDVVVDARMRRLGIAGALLNRALAFASQEGIKKVTLTSNSQRIEAIGLYKEFGFKKWDTNLFYKNID